MDQLKKFAHQLSEKNKEFCMEAPSMVKTHEFVDHLVHILFPIKVDCLQEEDSIGAALENSEILLLELLTSIKASLPVEPQKICDGFFARLPAAFDDMINDAKAMAKFDPASSCIEEIILCYPGFYCMSVYRMANILFRLDVQLIPRVMMEYVHSKTGIDIHPGSTIDTPFFIDHGTGVVIGETAVIGKNVKIYQGVTLGALTVEKSMAKTKRHPSIEDNVTIYAGSTILGGDTVIGHDTVVGGNTWITESVLPHSMVYRQHRVVVRDSKDYDKPLDFTI